MHDDTPFRLALLIWFAIIAPIGIYHRLRSYAPGDRLNRRAEGLGMLITLRTIALARLVAIAAYLINPEWMRWASFGMPTPIRWVGVGVATVGGALLISVFRTLGRNLTDTVVTRREHSLVTAGPYRWVRHPFYVAFAIVIVADTLIIANWFISLLGVIALSLLALRTPIEERKLIERFGDDYSRYMATTPRFVPLSGQSQAPARLGEADSVG